MADYHVYVLQNEGGRRYVGLSDDPLRRLQQHNMGLSRWTKNRGPWSLIWQSKGLSLSEARRLENRLKRQKGGHGFDHLIDQAGS